MALQQYITCNILVNTIWATERTFVNAIPHSMQLFGTEINNSIKLRITPTLYIIGHRTTLNPICLLHDFVLQFDIYEHMKDIQGSLLLTWVTLIPAFINNYVYYKVCVEITSPSPNFNSATVEVWEWVNNFIPHFSVHVITYPCWD